MAFILGDNGFYAGKSKVGTGKETRMVPMWSTKISEAQHLSNRVARKLIEKKEISGFIWKPYEEKHTSKKYKIILITADYGFNVDFFPHYSVEQHYASSDSDLKFLNRKGKEENIELYTKKEATRIVIEKNKKLIENLTELNINNKRNISKVFSL